MSRKIAADSTCVECENHIAPHAGPVAPAEGEYLVREIAGALVDLGRGQTVADWMADFVPAVAARHEPKQWPAVLVLDATTFHWTDPLTRKSMALFSILAAYGYDRDGKNGRLWKLEAAPSDDTAAWAEFLRSLPGTPESIVCDQAVTIIGGVNEHWGQWAAVNLIITGGRESSPGCRCD